MRWRGKGGRGCDGLARGRDGNVPAMGGKRMAIRPRKMSLEHMIAEWLLFLSVAFFEYRLGCWCADAITKRNA